MSARDLRIRDAAAEDEAAWRELWARYLFFYRQELPDAVTEATWRRILDPSAPILARIAEWRGTVTGFAVCVIHENTWAERPVCYLEDLFVADEARGSGLGRALIEDLLGLCRRRGWSRLYWHTDRSNDTARRLYDRFIEADDFVRYKITV